MSQLYQSFKDKIIYYYEYKPFILYIFIALAFFVSYVGIDFFNTYIYSFYPAYHSIYAHGAADSIYFSNAVDRLLSFKLPTSNFDGGLLALLIYILPVGFANVFHIDVGFSFRVFYAIILLLTGFGIFLTSKIYYSEQIALKLSFYYIFNPFIFFLSVWAGSEEIIEALFFVFILYFIGKEKLQKAIVLILIACFYKYYTILLLPIVLLSIRDSKYRLKVISILIIFLGSISSLVLIFLPRYVGHVYSTFIANFNQPGKGLYNLLLMYHVINPFTELEIIMYYLFMIFVYIVFLFKTRNSLEPFKYGIAFVLFFLLYPEFFSSYLIIPLVSLTILYPLVFFFFKPINLLVLPLASLFSEFSFTYADSPYALLSIEPTIWLRLIGISFLFLLYSVMLSWIYFYYASAYKKDNSVTSS